MTRRQMLLATALRCWVFGDHMSQLRVHARTRAAARTLMPPQVPFLREDPACVELRKLRSCMRFLLARRKKP